MTGPSPFVRRLTYLLLGLWALSCLFPVYWLVVTSVKSGDDIMQAPRYLPFVDFIPSLRAWNFILFDSNDNLVRRFINSTVVGLAATGLSLIFGSMVVYGLTRFRRGAAGGLLFSILLATRLLPPVVLVIPLYIAAIATGTIDTRSALALTYAAINLPAAIWLLRPVLGVKASEQEEAAMLDGASHLRIFATILIPMAAAGIAAAGLIVFVLCWNEYLLAAYLAGDRAMTLPPWAVGQLSMKEAQVGGEAEEWANMAAATILMALPLLAITAAVQRTLSRISLWKL